MAAGLGFKDFQTGEVLTAADVDGYLMQGIWVFANATARDAAVTSPQEGNFAFLKDTNTTTYYTGSAWTNLDTTGMVNPMTTTGDTIYSSSGSTPARLGIGTAGQVLQVNSGATAPEWATPAGGGGMTLLETLTLSGTSVVSSSIAGTYKDLQIIVRNYKPTGNGAGLTIRFNGDTGTNYAATQTGAQAYDATFGETQLTIAAQQNDTTATGLSYVVIPDYANSVTWKLGTLYGLTNFETNPTTNYSFLTYKLAWQDTSAITSVTFRQDNGGSLNGGSALIYGVK
jgi:hypothetical protein